MTKEGGDCDISEFDGKAILLGSEDNGYLFSSGYEIIIISTEDKIIGCKSIMDGDVKTYAIAIGKRYTKLHISNLNILKTMRLKKDFIKKTLTFLICLLIISKDVVKMFLGRWNILKSIPVAQTTMKLRKKVFGDLREN